MSDEYAAKSIKYRPTACDKSPFAQFPRSHRESLNAAAQCRVVFFQTPREGF
jgi:hypothetical protein